MGFGNIQPQMSKPQDDLPKSAPAPDQPAWKKLQKENKL